MHAPSRNKSNKNCARPTIIYYILIKVRISKEGLPSMGAQPRRQPLQALGTESGPPRTTASPRGTGFRSRRICSLTAAVCGGCGIFFQGTNKTVWVKHLMPCQACFLSFTPIRDDEARAAGRRWKERNAL